LNNLTRHQILFSNYLIILAACPLVINTISRIDGYNFAR
jgi:hypothetical protein